MLGLPEDADAGTEAADDVRFDEASPVTGASRIEAAWTGQDDGSASVAGAGDASGHVFTQTYLPWSGTLNPRWARNWAVYRHHLAGLVRSGHRPWPVLVRLYLLLVFIGAAADMFPILLSSILGDGASIVSVFGVSRNSLYAHVLGFFPRNILYYPVVTALIVGTMISEDRLNGTSALYFSRPISRLDYVVMKYLAAASVLGLLCIGTLVLFYFAEVLAMGRGWAWVVDTFPLLMAAVAAGGLLVVTYTSLGLGLSSVSTNGYFPAIGLLALVLGTKSLAEIVGLLFEQDVLYLFSPYDALASVGQHLLGIESNYDLPWTWSLVSVVAMNAVALYVLAGRVASMEVTRE